MNKALTVVSAKILLSLLAMLLLPPVTAQAQSPSFPIATNGVVMGFAFDGSNFLFSVENHLTTPTTIGAQMISTNGSKVGSLIATGRSGIATTVAFDGTNYLLIWEDNAMGTLTNESYQIYGQFISKAGTTIGSPFNISGLGVQFDGIKTMAFGGGKYLVTYTRLIVPENGSDSENRYIAGRIVSPNGVVGGEFRISTGYGKASDVAFDGSNFLVVWCEDYGDYEIRGRFVSPAGVPGTEVSINSSLAPSDNPNSVVFGDGHYLVVWNDEMDGSGTDTWDCFGQLVATNGALVGGVIPITTEPGPQMVTSAAFDGSHYLAVWADMQNPVNWDCFGQFLYRNGSRFGDKLVISTNLENQLCGVGFANGKFGAVINNGVIMGENGISQIESSAGTLLDPPANPQVQTGNANFGVKTNRFGFTIAGYSNVVVVVEACTNLANPAWLPVQTNILTNGSSYFSDPQWTNHARRFYRLSSP